MIRIAKIALSAAAILGSATAAFAYDVPEASVSGIQTAVHMNAKMTAIGHFSGNANEVPEYRIGDRYPALEPTSARHAVWRVAISTPVAYEVPEDRIGDKYPLLVQSGTQRGMKALASTGRFHKQAQKQTMKNKV
jgi:hypothetical protein